MARLSREALQLEVQDTWESPREGKPVQGRGYVELTGYVEAPRDVR